MKFDLYVILKNGRSFWVEREDLMEAIASYNEYKSRDCVEGVFLNYYDGKCRDVLKYHWCSK